MKIGIYSSSCNINPLINSDHLKTCTAMHSFIGAYKAISRCIASNSSLMCPLEAFIKVFQGRHLIQWNSDLSKHFHDAQKSLYQPDFLTIPIKSDKLTMTVDTSPVNSGISATLFPTHRKSCLVADNFSLMLKSHQIGWQP